MAHRFMHGSRLLMGNATVPGVPMTKELRELIPTILKACTDFGLDYYPTVVQMLTYDEISEIAAYGGFPVRYPHWRWGMEYEELQRGYEYGMHKIYEMVINTNPCYIYCLNSNTLLDHITVIAHATGHNHFFKNNLMFSPTSQNMMNELANHGTRIRRYISRWGKEKVTEFIDHIIRIDTLLDFSKAWQKREIKDPVVRDSRKYLQPRRLKVDNDRLYMDPYVNTKQWREYENKRIEKKEASQELGIFEEPTKDIFGYIKDNAPLKPWQADIMSMIYEESLYFAPQRMTKTINEGFASWVDYNIMSKQGFIGLGQKEYDTGIIEYAAHKMGVLGGKYSMNPYKLGYYLLESIEDRWNKGKFGTEYDDCTDIRVKEKWDKNLGLGKEKVMEVCKYYDDVTLISEFFTQDFCDEFEFFEWKHYPNGEYRIESRDAKAIKAKLLRRHVNGGLPDIRLTDPNHRGKGQFFLQHQWDGRPLYDNYVRDTLTSLRFLVGADVFLATRDTDGKEIVDCCKGSDPEKGVEVVTRQTYQRNWSAVA
jgi:stage V sporulation protein R